MAGTIVYVDVEPDLPEGLVREFGRLGFRLHHTADLDQALTLTRDGVARLVVVEVLLGRERGWELIRQIRTLEPPLREIPIIILTRAERTPELYAQAVELGVEDFLARPVTRAEILSAVLECVDTSVDARGFNGPVGASGGDLGSDPVADLLLRLRDEAATGVLFLQNFEAVDVQLRNGSPIGVNSSRGDESFADFLSRTKRISGNEHGELLEHAHASGESEPVAAVSIGALSSDEVQAALADRAAEPLLEAFGWTSGSWRFEPRRRLRSGQALEGGAARALVQGVLEWAPSRGVRAMLDRRGALYLSKVDHAPHALEELAQSPCDPNLLNQWAGDHTIAEVLESGVIGERELCALLVAGLVEGRAETLLELDRVVEAADEPEEEPELLLEDEAPTEPPRLESPAPVARKPIEAKGKKKKKQQQKRKRVAAPEPSTAMPETEPVARVVAPLPEQAADLDGDTTPRPGPKRYTAPAATPEHDAASAAVQAPASDPELEAAPEQTLEAGHLPEEEPAPAREPEPPPEQDTASDAELSASGSDSAAAEDAAEDESAASRSKDAERHFGHGERQLAAKRYDDAVEAFGLAAHLDPSQGEYRAHLGYALHLQHPASDVVRKEALEHIARGIKLAAEQWKPLLFLARVFIAAGEHRNARKVLLSAIHRHPECEPLQAELKRLKRALNEKTSGFMARLKRSLGS